MMVGSPLGVIFAADVTIFCSKCLRFTAMKSSSYSGGSDDAAEKERGRAAWIHVRNVAIFYYRRSTTSCAVISVYAAGGDR